MPLPYTTFSLCSALLNHQIELSIRLSLNTKTMTDPYQKVLRKLIYFRYQLKAINAFQ